MLTIITTSCRDGIQKDLHRKQQYSIKKKNIAFEEWLLYYNNSRSAVNVITYIIYKYINLCCCCCIADVGPNIRHFVLFVYIRSAVVFPAETPPFMLLFYTLPPAIMTTQQPGHYTHIQVSSSIHGTVAYILAARNRQNASTMAHNT